ncbi:MAG: hypothetical protein ABI353_22755 [Isosphaeraceae bacterium]
MSMLLTLPLLSSSSLPAKKPSGPATDAGRRASSRNSFKHGFSGSGAVLPDDLRDEVNARRDAYADRFGPTDATEQDLVFQMALASVRMSRISEADTAQTEERVRHAVQRWDETRAAEVRACADRLDAEPVEAVRLLRRIAEGTDYLADEWESLTTALHDQGAWTDDQATRALRLLGMDNATTDRSTSRLNDYWLDVEAARSGDPSARDRLAEIANTQIEELVSLGEQHWNQFDQPDRDDAPRRALFDTSPAGVKLSRYLADAQRLYYRSLNELNRLRAQAEKERSQNPRRFVNPRPAPSPPPSRNEPASPPPVPSPSAPSVAPGPVSTPAPGRSQNDPSVQILNNLLETMRANRIDPSMTSNGPLNDR